MLLSYYSYHDTLGLFECEFLLDTPTIGTDDVDTGDRYVALDGLTRLNGEGGNGVTCRAVDADIGSLTERRGDSNHTTLGEELQTKMGHGHHR